MGTANSIEGTQQGKWCLLYMLVKVSVEYYLKFIHLIMQNIY